MRQSAAANARAKKLVRTRVGRIISVPDNATDTSLFCLPVQANGADAFKLTLYLISRALQGVDGRIVHILHDELIVEARDGIVGQESLDLILPYLSHTASRQVSNRGATTLRTKIPYTITRTVS